MGGATGGAVAGATSSAGDQAIQLDPESGLPSLGPVDGVEALNDAIKGAMIGKTLDAIGDESDGNDDERDDEDQGYNGT